MSRNQSRHPSRDICWTEMRSPMACERLVHKLRRSSWIEDENTSSAPELGKEVCDE